MEDMFRPLKVDLSESLGNRLDEWVVFFSLVEVFDKIWNLNFEIKMTTEKELCRNFKRVSFINVHSTLYTYETNR